jgi:hypothetical protein
MPKGERFFHQSRRIFAGGLTPGKKIQRRVAEKDPPLGRFDIFQTWPNIRQRRFSPPLSFFHMRKKAAGSCLRKSLKFGKEYCQPKESGV